MNLNGLAKNFSDEDTARASFIACREPPAKARGSWRIASGTQWVRNHPTTLTGSLKPMKPVSAFGSHGVVTHSTGKYVRREPGKVVHTNTGEGYSSILERGINRVYHHVGKRSTNDAVTFVRTLAARAAGKFQFATDTLRPYYCAVP